MFKSLDNISEWNDVTEHQRIGEILMSSGKISLLHLSMALDAQRFQKLPLGVLFVMMKAISKDDLEKALIIQTHIDHNISEKGS